MKMDKDKKKTILQIGNLVTPILCGVVIAIGSVGTNWQSVFGADPYDKLLDPAGFTFAIWGPIFFFIGLFYVYQARDLFRSEKLDMPYVHQVSVFFMASTVATTAWYLLWANGFIWPSVLTMAIYLVSLLAGYLRLEINKVDRSVKEHLYITAGWSLYTGWITAALIVNTTTGFAAAGFDAPILGEVGWTILILGVALIIYVLVLVNRNDYTFAGVGAWATFGVFVERLLNPTAPIVTLVAGLGALILIFAIILWGYRMKKLGRLTFFTKLRNR